MSSARLRGLDAAGPWRRSGAGGSAREGAAAAAASPWTSVSGTSGACGHTPLRRAGWGSSGSASPKAGGVRRSGLAVEQTSAGLLPEPPPRCPAPRLRTKGHRRRAGRTDPAVPGGCASYYRLSRPQRRWRVPQGLHSSGRVLPFPALAWAPRRVWQHGNLEIKHICGSLAPRGQQLQTSLFVCWFSFWWVFCLCVCF